MKAARHRRWSVAVLGILGTLSLPDLAAACSVCYGATGDAMTQGMNNGILTLLAVVGVVQVGFVAMFWSFWRRSRDLRQRREKFRILEGGAK